MSFDSFGLPGFLLKTLKSVNLTTPTPVQKATIPEILKGRNVLARSPTGSGKTAAFALPVISKLSKDPYGIYCIVISPTRELGEQIAEQFKLFGKGMGISVVTVFGGLSFHIQSSEIETTPHILVATPGRLLQHLTASTKFIIKDLKFLVLDEVDRLFNEGFWEDVEKIISFLPETRQTLLYSATLSAELPYQKLMASEPFRWEPKQSEMPKIQHLITPVPAYVREVYLICLLEDIQKENDFSQVLIFTSHCETAEEVTLILRKLQYKTAVLHSKMEQDDRFQSLKEFRAGRQRILVATDVAARGLDIPFVDVVIHFNPPKDETIYVHRSGRTGRAGRAGKSILFVNGPKDANLVQRIEKAIGQKMEELIMTDQDVTAKLKDVVTAKKDAHVTMTEKNFGEREKKLRAGSDVC